MDEIERVKRDVNVETVEKDIRYFHSTLIFGLQNQKSCNNLKSFINKLKIILNFYATFPSSVFHLNDSHLHLMVHWAGQGSSIVFCLARDQVDAKYPHTLFSRISITVILGNQ